MPDLDSDHSRTPNAGVTDILAHAVSQQLVLDLGGEFLADSGFEAETPEPDFTQRS